MSMTSLEEARQRLAERKAALATMSPFEQFWAAWPDRNGIKQGQMMAQIKFDALTTTGLTTRVYDKHSDIYHAVKHEPVAASVLIEAARRYASKVAEIRLSGKTAFVQDAAKWLNDGEWRS